MPPVLGRYSGFSGTNRTAQRWNRSLTALRGVRVDSKSLPKALRQSAQAQQFATEHLAARERLGLGDSTPAAPAVQVVRAPRALSPQGEAAAESFEYLFSSASLSDAETDVVQPTTMRAGESKAVSHVDQAFGKVKVGLEARARAANASDEIYIRETQEARQQYIQAVQAEVAAYDALLNRIEKLKDRYQLTLSQDGADSETLTWNYMRGLRRLYEKLSTMMGQTWHSIAAVEKDELISQGETFPDQSLIEAAQLRRSKLAQVIDVLPPEFTFGVPEFVFDGDMHNLQGHWETHSPEMPIAFHNQRLEVLDARKESLLGELQGASEYAGNIREIIGKSHTDKHNRLVKFRADLNVFRDVIRDAENLAHKRGEEATVEHYREALEGTPKEQQAYHQQVKTHGIPLGQERPKLPAILDQTNNYLGVRHSIYKAVFEHSDVDVDRLEALFVHEGPQRVDAARASLTRMIVTERVFSVRMDGLKSALNRTLSGLFKHVPNADLKQLKQDMLEVTPETYADFERRVLELYLHGETPAEQATYFESKITGLARRFKSYTNFEDQLHRKLQQEGARSAARFLLDFTFKDAATTKARSMATLISKGFGFIDRAELLRGYAPKSDDTLETVFARWETAVQEADAFERQQFVDLQQTLEAVKSDMNTKGYEVEWLPTLASRIAKDLNQMAERREVDLSLFAVDYRSVVSIYDSLFTAYQDMLRLEAAVTEEASVYTKGSPERKDLENKSNIYMAYAKNLRLQIDQLFGLIPVEVEGVIKDAMVETLKTQLIDTMKGETAIVTWLVSRSNMKRDNPDTLLDMYDGWYQAAQMYKRIVARDKEVGLTRRGMHSHILKLVRDRKDRLADMTLAQEQRDAGGFYTQEVRWAEQQLSERYGFEVKLPDQIPLFARANPDTDADEDYHKIGEPRRVMNLHLGTAILSDGLPNTNYQYAANGIYHGATTNMSTVNSSGGVMHLANSRLQRPITVVNKGKKGKPDTSHVINLPSTYNYALSNPYHEFGPYDPRFWDTSAELDPAHQDNMDAYLAWVQANSDFHKSYGFEVDVDLAFGRSWGADINLEWAVRQNREDLYVVAMGGFSPTDYWCYFDNKALRSLKRRFNEAGVRMILALERQFTFHKYNKDKDGPLQSNVMVIAGLEDHSYPKNWDDIPTVYPDEVLAHRPDLVGVNPRDHEQPMPEFWADIQNRLGDNAVVVFAPEGGHNIFTTPSRDGSGGPDAGIIEAGMVAYEHFLAPALPEGALAPSDPVAWQYDRYQTTPFTSHEADDTLVVNAGDGIVDPLVANPPRDDIEWN